MTLDHAGDDELGDTQGTGAVDGDDIGHLGGRGLGEGNGDRVALADIVHEDGHIQIGDQLAQRGVVFIGVLREVHGQGLGLHGGVLLGDFLAQGDQLGLGSGYKNNVEFGTRQLQRELFAQAIGGTGDNGPATRRTEGTELSFHISILDL